MYTEQKIKREKLHFAKTCDRRGECFKIISTSKLFKLSRDSIQNWMIIEL